MNEDEIKSMVVKVLLMLLTFAATKFHMDGSLVPAVASDVADLITLAIGYWMHAGMKKVPENTVVVSASATKVGG